MVEPKVEVKEDSVVSTTSISTKKLTITTDDEIVEVEEIKTITFEEDLEKTVIKETVRLK